MPFIRPTITQIVARVKSDLESRMTSGSATLRRSVIFVLATVIAASVHLLYGAIEFFSRQIFGDKAEAEFLIRLASIFGVAKKVAAYAEGDVEFTGTNGSVIEEGTRWQRSDGLFFQTTEEGTISGGSVTLNVIAEEAGENSNTEVDVELTAVSPIAGVSSTATVSGTGIKDGTNEEDDETFRERYLERTRQPPQGGALTDYVRWALEVGGVTRAWSYPLWGGPQYVGVTFVLDDEVDIIPDVDKVAEVQAYIDTLRPVTDQAVVFAPTPVEQDFTIELIDADTAAIREAIEAELTDLIKREAEPGGTLRLSHIQEAISIASGEVDHDLQSPVADVETDTSELLIMGTITWI